MNHQHWEDLIAISKGGKVDNPIGFIIDSPWLPGWYGISIFDYYSNGDLWFKANKKAIETFPNVMFIPGFWSEYGMCTEPSAFGAKMIWRENDLPHAEKVLESADAISNIKKPNVKTDGLLPFMIRRLQHYENDIEQLGHSIRFAVTRGPLNIASFLMGTTELMMAITMQREEVIRFLDTIADFIIDWVTLQTESFASIDGLIVLDDLVGFLDENDFREIALPFLKKIYATFDFNIRLFHNDAFGLVTAKFLNDIDINIFNFSFEHSMEEIQTITANKVTLLGNLPPRDVLAAGSPEAVKTAAIEMKKSISNHKRVVWSCGGGMPPDVSSENITAFIEGIKSI
jgi:uroporphyrinogen decarboxylase